MSGSTIERAADGRSRPRPHGHLGRHRDGDRSLHRRAAARAAAQHGQDVEDATAAARVAQAAWWAAGDAHRRRVLLKAHDLLLERREELLDAVQTETGKTRGQAFEEVFNAANATRYNALSARRVLKGGRRRGGIPFVFSPACTTRRRASSGIITPWNYPLALAIMDIAPALAAGNGVIQKADNQGAISILTARRAFIDAGLPAALWAVVAGPGGEIGNAVVDAGDYIVFTGSTATGKTRRGRAAARIVGSSMELGGKNAAIVLDDVDPVKAAAAVANFCFTASGQLCVSIERVYVLRGVADAFIPALAGRVKAMSIGPAFDYSTDFGSLATAQQLENVMAHIDDAKKKGVTVLAGGERPPRHRPVLRRAHRVHGRDRRHEVRDRRDVRPGRLRLRGRHGGRGDRGRQRQRLRPERRRFQPLAFPCARRRDAVSRRQRERQRGLPRVLRQHGRPHGRREAVRHRAAQRPRGPAALCRVAHGRGQHRPAHPPDQRTGVVEDGGPDAPPAPHREGDASPLAVRGCSRLGRLRVERVAGRPLPSLRCRCS